ncbi:hypothetical protein HNP46_004218 [Pseudomonas nitritireducens]|uniref:Uncharacterized protein n=1 Tax=Pseudomonas nitroreducens TaxID=46680 RepID=A0A7W7KM41_PSENT|nr:hypothetical protein [Pseudomonas nitritireducens]MBB4865337.1 hypothetical protein [Pseudomonas nitritireducens]
MNLTPFRKRAIIPGHGLFQGELMHQNPRWYKYTWVVVTKDTPDDVVPEPLCYAEYKRLTAEIIARGEGYFSTNRQQPRMGPDTPFDPNAERWRGVTFAPAFDDDPDPICNGFK